MTVRRSTDSGLELGTRVDALAANFAELDKEVGGLYGLMDERHREVLDAIKAECQTRQAEIRHLKEQVQEVANGNFAWLAFGAGWVAVGTVLGALAPELAALH